MSTEYEDEFRNRLEDSRWDRRIGECVVREFESRNRKAKVTQAILVILVCALGVLWDYKIQIELTLDDTGFELLSHINGTDFLIFDIE